MTQPVVPSGWTRFQNGDAAGLDRADTDLIDILNAVEAPIIVVGRDFTVSCFNQAAASVLGFAPSHIGLTSREAPALATSS